MRNAADRLYDQILALRCMVGDDSALEELVDRYHDRVRYYIRGQLDNADTVDDVLQEVWLAVFRRLPQLRSSEALPVWLYRIARNAVLRTFRDTRRSVELTDEPVTPAPPEEELEFSPRDAANLHASLERLRPAHREVLVLRFVQQMDYEEIAAVVGCPIGTVRSRLHYAKQALRREVGD